MEENEGQRKQAKDKGVFFWFGDDGAMYPQSHSAAGKVRVQAHPVADILDLKIPNRLVY